MTAAYCGAVLSHDQRIALDGAPAEAVDAKAKDLATKRLAQIAAKAAKKAAVMAKPKPAAPLAAPQLGLSHWRPVAKRPAWWLTRST